MIDKKSKLILNYLNNSCSSKKFTTSQDISKALNIPNKDVCAALKYLDSIDYLNLIHIDGEDIEMVRSLTHKGLNYKEFNNNPASSIKQTFNIKNVTNSAFANNGTTNLNNGVSFSEIKEFINKQSISDIDKENLSKLTNYLELLVENNTPMSKGTLSKFSDLLAKHSWATTLIGNILVNHFTH